MRVVYDSGALIAAERDDRAVWAEHRVQLQWGVVPLTTAPVVAQVSRSGRQALLRRFLSGCAIVALTEDQAHAVGRLLAATGGADVVDAHVALVAGEAGASVLTSDVDALVALAARLPSPVAVRQI